ncbi:MAG: phage virion morphogenesis protein [Pseudomonadota bacterium]
MIEIKVDGKAVMIALDRLAATAHDISPVMSMIAAELERQTEANFAAQGRPKWQGLSRASIGIVADKCRTSGVFAVTREFFAGVLQKRMNKGFAGMGSNAGSVSA